MNQYYLFRGDTSDKGTPGYFFSEDFTFNCYSLELPWRENATSISHIPADTYVCEVYQSPRFGVVFKLRNVEGRTYILIHSGNYAGDKKKGFATHSAGCILLGKTLADAYPKNKKQFAVFHSRITLRRFMQHTGNRKFILTIK